MVKVMMVKGMEITVVVVELMVIVVVVGTRKMFFMQTLTFDDLFPVARRQQ